MLLMVGAEEDINTLLLSHSKIHADMVLSIAIIIILKILRGEMRGDGGRDIIIIPVTMILDVTILDATTPLAEAEAITTVRIKDSMKGGAVAKISAQGDVLKQTTATMMRKGIIHLRDDLSRTLLLRLGDPGTSLEGLERMSGGVRKRISRGIRGRMLVGLGGAEAGNRRGSRGMMEMVEGQGQGRRRLREGLVGGGIRMGVRGVLEVVGSE